MRVLLYILFAAMVLIRVNYQLPDCRWQNALLAIPPRIHFEQTIDGQDQSRFLTRFYHNKAGIIGSEFGECYFQVIDPVYIFKVTGFIGLAAWIWAIYHLAMKKKFLPLILIAIYPVLYFANIFQASAPYYHKLIALYGLIVIFRLKE